jgi:hypothetical protein
MRQDTRISFGKKWQWLFLFVCTLGCTNEQKAPFTGLRFVEYKISGEEGLSDIIFLAQFKPDPQAIPQKLRSPANVLLDGRELNSDSARLSGAFYEAAYPLDAFAGEHTIVYNDGNEKHNTTFTFQPFSVAGSFPQKISRKDFRFIVEGLENAQINLSLVDTAFMNDDLHRIIAVKDGEVNISPEMLTGLRNGPIHMELIYEEKTALKGRLSGFLLKTFVVRREFILVN